MIGSLEDPEQNYIYVVRVKEMAYEMRVAYSELCRESSRKILTISKLPGLPYFDKWIQPNDKCLGLLLALMLAAMVISI